MLAHSFKKILSVKTHGVIVAGMPQNAFQKGTFHRSIAYLVGSQSFSLDDIKEGILRSNGHALLSPAKLLVRQCKRKIRKTSFQGVRPQKKVDIFSCVFIGSEQGGTNDPLSRYCISPVDPRIHFVLCSGSR